MRLDEFEVEFGFNPLDFTQVNSTINPQMVKLACDLLQLQQGERVLRPVLWFRKLFFALWLVVSVQPDKWLRVEGSEEMVQRGAENANE